MPVDCARSSTGGKGNIGFIIQRDSKVCAAGLPTAQPDDKVSDFLQHCLLKEEVDSLLHDSIHPALKTKPLPPLRHPIAMDKRFAGLHGDVAQLINPVSKTKFQTVVDEIKETTYTSYWKKQVGKVPDPVPMLPPGLDLINTTFGRKSVDHGRLYDLVMPKISIVDKTPKSKNPAVQTDRNYCKPAFNPELTFGQRINLDKRGIYAKCCLTDEKIIQGNSEKVTINSIQANFQLVNQPRAGNVLAPYDNIKEVPKGYSFGKLKPPGNLPECLTNCVINPELKKIRKCLGHLNTLRKVMSTRFLPTFYNNFYLNLQFFDVEKKGWLLNTIVYDFCGTKFIRFDPSLIEPLLQIWNAFNDSKIKYKTFVYILNFKQPLPSLPHIPDVPDSCLYFLSTYAEMVEPNQKSDPKPMAGLPSGRYFDSDYPVTVEGYCKAHRACLPQESNMESCLKPSVYTLHNISHRDMYAKREFEVVRRVFENIGEKFDDDKFKTLWEKAQSYHSQGWVCFETFLRALAQSNAK